jgi:MFS family permease
MLLTMGIGAVPCGMLGDRFGKRRVFGLGLLLMGIAALLAASAVTVPQLMLYVLFIGIGNAAQTVLFFPYLIELIPSSRVGEFTGLSAFAETSGVVFSVLLAGELINLNLFGLHYRLVFCVTGLFILLAFGALLLIRRKYPYVRPMKQSHAGQRTLNDDDR